MAQWYVDADAAGGGDGSQGTPYNTMSDAVSAAGAGDTINCQGVFRGRFTLTLPDNCIMQQWAGQTAWEIRASEATATTDWTDNEDGTFSLTVGGGVTVTSVVHDWDDTTFTVGPFSHTVHGGHLRTGSFASLAEGQWAQSGTELKIHPVTGWADPDTGDDYEYTIVAVAALLIQNSTNPTVRDLTTKLSSDNSASDGYGVMMRNCTNATVENVTVWDGGAHSIGCVNNNTTTALGASEIRNCTVYALHGGSSGQSQIVTFSNEASGIDGAGGGGNTYLSYGTLDYDGVSLNAARNIAGWFAHAGSGAEVVDIEFDGETIIGIDGHINEPFGIGGSGDTEVSGDELDWATYPVRFTGCSAINCTNMGLSADATKHIAWRRSFFDFQRAAIAGGSSLGTTTAAMRFGPSGATSATCGVLFEACVIICDVRDMYDTGGSFVGPATGVRSKTTGGTVVNSVVGMAPGTNTDVILSNSTYHLVNNAGSADAEHFWGQTSTTRWVMLDSILTATVDHNLGVGASQTSANLADSDGNLYFRVATGLYWSVASFNTAEEWESLIDANGFYGQDPELDGQDNVGTATSTGFSSGQLGLVDMIPTVDGWVYDNPQVRDGVTIVGINGNPYSGHLGAFQFGDGGGETIGTGVPVVTAAAIIGTGSAQVLRVTLDRASRLVLSGAITINSTLYRSVSEDLDPITSPLSGKSVTDEARTVWDVLIAADNTPIAAGSAASGTIVGGSLVAYMFETADNVNDETTLNTDSGASPDVVLSNPAANGTIRNRVTGINRRDAMRFR